MVRMKNRGLCKGIGPAASAVLLAFGITGFVTSVEADDSMRSSSPDTALYSRPVVPEDLTLGNTAGAAGLAAGISFTVVDTVVDNTNPTDRVETLFRGALASIGLEILSEFFEPGIF